MLKPKLNELEILLEEWMKNLEDTIFENFDFDEILKINSDSVQSAYGRPKVYQHHSYYGIDSSHPQIIAYSVKKTIPADGIGIGNKLAYYNMLSRDITHSISQKLKTQYDRSKKFNNNALFILEEPYYEVSANKSRQEFVLTTICEMGIGIRGKMVEVLKQADDRRLFLDYKSRELFSSIALNLKRVTGSNNPIKVK